MNTRLLLIALLLGGCVAYPEPYPVVPAAPDPAQAQAAANAQCARSGKVAVRVSPTECSGGSCTSTFHCR